MDDFLGVLFVVAVGSFLVACALFVAFAMVAAAASVGALLAAGVGVAAFGRSISASVATRGGARRAPKPPEPAFELYVLGQLREDVSVACAEGLGALTRAREKCARFAKRFSDGATMPLAVGAVVGGWVGTCVAAVIGAMLAAPIIVLAAIFTGGAWLVVGFLRALEWARRRVRKTQYECPEDHERFPLPVYVCPSCGAEHRRLVPGRWGLLRRECRCGRAALPTMVLNGRQRIPQRCPSGHPMSGMIGFAENLRVALVGGPSAGKSTYLAAALIELEGLAATGRFAVDVFDESRSAYDGALQAMRNGVLPHKTQAANPALVAEVQGGGRSRVLYAYDVSGERYSNADATRELRFLEVPSALLLLVDPLAIPQVASDLGEQIQRNRAALLPSVEDPMRVLERALAALVEAGVDATKIPVAVVVAKTDAFGIGDEIARHGGDAPVRDWLIEHGAGNFARTVEHEFKQVGWFRCSALGRMPTDGDSRPYAPEGAVAPLLWTLERRGVTVAERPFAASHTQQRLAADAKFGPISRAGWRWRIGLAATGAGAILAAGAVGIVLAASSLTGNGTASANQGTNLGGGGSSTGGGGGSSTGGGGGSSTGGGGGSSTGGGGGSSTGGGNGGTNQTPTVATSPDQASNDAQRTVSQYWGDIKSGDFESAYGLYTAQFDQDRVGDQSSWVSAEQDESISDVYAQVSQGRADDRTAKIPVDVKTWDRHGCNHFVGSFSLQRRSDGWKIDDVSLNQGSCG